MTNFHFDITAEGDEVLARAMKIAFTEKDRVVGFALRSASPANPEPAYAPIKAKPLRMVFFWGDPNPSAVPDFTAFPFRLDADGAADFARRWLAEAQYPAEPDHDGSNSKGFRVYNERHAHVDGHFAAFVAVAPAWIEYGK